MEVKSIQKKYGKKIILKSVSFDAKKGECIGILGANGCGKSTLLGILAGIRCFDSGSFIYGGYDLLADKEKRSIAIGYVSQNAPLLEELTAYDNLRLWYEKGELERSVQNGVIKLLEIDKFIRTPVRKMSGGMKKRLAIACAVASNPQILILDEPTASLDLICKKKISEYITKFKKGGGIVILATHDAQELTICDKLYILKNGLLNSYTYDGNINSLTERLQENKYEL